MGKAAEGAKNFRMAQGGHSPKRENNVLPLLGVLSADGP